MCSRFARCRLFRCAGDSLVFPNFVGIGVPRSGTTWLHALLDAHPDVAMPQRRKEIHFFDDCYERGTQWYESFFPRDSERARYKAVGEITPRYLYIQECPGRIAAMPSIQRIILLLRNPVERAFSDYILRMKLDNYRGSFEQFLIDKPRHLDRGFYTDHIKEYLKYFPFEQMAILIFERMFQDIPATRNQIADFLDINANRFPAGAGAAQVNSSALPKLRTAYSLASRTSLWLRRRDLDFIPNLFTKSLGTKRLFGRSKQSPRGPSSKTRLRLFETYANDIEALERLLGFDLDIWKIR